MRLAVIFWAVPAVAGPIVAALDILGGSGPEPERGVAALLDLWPLAFFGLIAVLTVRFHKHKSRAASTLLFAIFIGTVIVPYLKYGLAAAGPGVGLQLFTGFIFFLGMRGTYLWHSTYRYAPPTPEVQLMEDDASSPEPDEQEPLARPCDDLCPNCFEYFEADELTCRYCGTDLRSRSRVSRA